MLRSLWDKFGSSLAPITDPYAVHDDATMEGYYTHVHSSASTGNPFTLVVIFCQVKTAIDPTKRILVYAYYQPGSSSTKSSRSETQKLGGFVREQYASNWKVTQHNSFKGTRKLAEYTIEVGDIGKMEIRKDMQRWTVNLPAGDDMPASTLVVEATKRASWSSTSEVAGPEGPFERLGYLLPLHWHVFSPGSQAYWYLERPQTGPSQPKDQSSFVVSSGHGVAHIEKNHGTGFPSGWIWAHTVSPSASSKSHTDSTPRKAYPIRLAVAGGRIIGLEAYLLGFRDEERQIEWDFKPPWSMGLFGRGAGLRTTRDWDCRTVVLDVWDWGRWLHVEMRAPEDTFIGISGPLSKGFAPNLCQESFQATFTIALRERRLSFGTPTSFFSAEEWRWREVAKYEVDESALEFGGDYVGEPLRNMKVHGE